MSEPFLKSLECSCIKGTSATCPGGGEISATMTLQEGALFATIENDSKITSPGESLTVSFSDINGAGPYFIISGCSGDHCELVSAGWSVEITGTYNEEPFLITSEIINKYNNGSYLIFYDGPIYINDAVINSIQATGVAHPTPPSIVRTRSVLAILESQPEIASKLSASLLLDLDAITSESEIVDDLTANYTVSQDVVGESDVINTYTDKIAGDASDFECQGKLYPSGDLPVDDGFGSFISINGQTNDLWSYINEGVYEGIVKTGGDSNLLSDDYDSFIQPNSIHTEGFFQYKCELTEMYIRPDDSVFRIRVSAPLQNYESKTAPLYTLYNIKLSDPSGNLIVKYKDIQLFGDSTDDHPNFATYSCSPEINLASEKYDWERNVPHMYNISGYQLSFSVRAVSLDDPFDPGFDFGFEENYIIPETFYASGNNYLSLDGQPLSTQEVRFINPTKGFRVSAFEICNSGGYGPRTENYLPFRMAVREKGRRLERCINPTFMPLNVYDTTIYPAITNNVWENDTATYTNEDICGSQELINILNVKDERNYITLQTIDGGGVANSGKLILKFQTGSSYVDEITPGDFNFAFDQGTKNTWWKPSGAFNVEKRNEDIQEDIPFYNVESITLKVLAKKSAGSRDYILDVVGYSDDKLLAVTSPSGGFIQDPSGVYLNDTFISQVGNHPVLSGFYNDNSDWVVGGGSLSERDDYFEASGNDHYKLAQYPTVTGTEFSLYEIPLVILDDNVKIGASRDYSVSSFLENVYLDIYPLPSGASIAYAELCVRYAPTNAINLYSQGGEKIGKAQDGRSEAALYPSGMQSYDDILNAGSGYQPISHLENLPHLYSSPDTIKTNYSRRWRGVEGTVCGPFDADGFSFSFENPVIDYPFLSGYFKFDNIENGYVKSVELGPIGTPSGLGTSSGLLVGSPTVYQNIGWRFSSGTLFQDQLPGFSGNYTTTDWTSLSNGSTTFVGNPMYGKIADAFDRVIRINGRDGSQKIDFGNIDTASGFAVFIRFTPDSNVSGVSYDLFESGVLFAKWNSAAQMDFALGYKDGYLCGYAQDNANNIIEVIDTIKYSGYQFPLNAILTYNDNESKRLKLYTDNEFASNFDILRASSSPFDKNITNANLVLGYADGSGVGMNMLVSEFGVSAYSSGVDTLYGSGTNIVESNPDKTYKRVTAETFLENSRAKYFDPNESYTNDRYKLWDRVNEDTYNDWQIGDFKYCQFGFAFDQWQKRPNTEQIVFHLKHHGSGYSQNNDLPLLSNINSGVAYHTQMENDFLRFHLTDVPNSFYSVNRRITKNIPTGYKFSEKALVVETVIEHKTEDDIKWPTCEDISPSGPRMIVSLYTKKQEPYWTADEPNWGLVNRKIHYIKPNSCLIKLESTFSYEDIVDETEEWAIFPKEPRLKDFSERYFKDDVNQMFVQYDLVYPSGPAFESKLEMHSSHVRMADVNIHDVDVSGNINLNVSGGFPVSSQINLNIGGFPTEINDTLPLSIQVPIPYDVFTGHPSGFHLSMSGALRQENFLNLYIPPQSGYSYFNLNISGELPSASYDSLALNMPVTLGVLDSSDDGNPATSIAGQGNFFGMPLSVYNAELAGSPDGPVLNLNMFASSGSLGLLSALPLALYNNRKNTTATAIDGLVNFNILGRNQTVSSRHSKTMPLYINAPNIINNDIPLYLHNPLVESLLTSAVNLVTGSSFLLWNDTNYGADIDLEDNHAAFLPVNNEIRGVDLVAYGSCTGDSPSKAIDQALITDCVTWREETCVDGGIFRAKATYTNPNAINFEGGLGYSGNYYGIRKFEQLIPSLPYQATMVIKTGSTDAIPVPRTFEEWEYGMCGPAWYESGCCTQDCDENIVFSGVKLVADDACGVPPSSNLCADPDLILASGRNEDDTYGRSVKVNGDLMGIAAPNITIPDYSPYDESTIDVSGAGAIFLYRRDQDEAGKKAKWSYIEQLMLPEGFRKDYIQRTTDKLLQFDQFAISGNKWQIGQEGRQFGESLDICSSGDREVVVVGAPRAKWYREFEDIAVSSIPTAGMIFADLFDYDKNKLQNVAASAGKFNILYKYFSAPWNPGPDEWYAQINPKMIVLQLAYSNRDYPVVPNDESSWFTHKYIPRLDDIELVAEVGSEALGGVGSYYDFINAGRPIIFNEMLSGVKEAFFATFPSGSTVMYSGIPAIVGMFKEQTGSTAAALQYADQYGNIKNIYDEFEKFYLAHSYASGVKDLVQDIAQSGHLNTIVGKSEGWDTTLSELLSDTFDSGRLSSTYTNTTLNRDFITSGVGQEWGATHGPIVSEFQIPPASGGRVYIFENERGNFNCIQVINSPNDVSENFENVESSLGAVYGKTYNDRYGHSVAISNNGEVIAVGSPWTNKPCNIFERNEDEVQKVYNRIKDWCVINNTSAANHYDEILIQSGVDAAKTSTYDFLTSSQRFAYRNDINFWGTLPTPYSLTYEYGYGDINYLGTRQFLLTAFAPTSRMGWSCSVDGDGEIVAFGAPTDSLNEFDDVNVWGDSVSSWASYVNAGAVRLFHNRKYYPHDKVVEFGRFGNLDRSSHPEERALGYYDQSNWPLIFGSGADGTSSYQGKEWRRTAFSEIEIPQDAGLAFIITPELDAASDEIIQNIKDWLALGDRNLVLVGNDPIWEENGLYQDSNEIINKILEKLGSRMRIQPAKDITYSMQNCVSQENLNDGKYNATASFLPTNSTSRTIEYQGEYYVKGVGDIRIDLSRDNLQGYFESLSCPEGKTCDGEDPPIINSKCEFPLLGSGGDLRAEWKEQCVLTLPNDSCKIVNYRKNWPLMFNTYSVECDESPQPLFFKGSQEPIPVLTTAEHLPPIYWYNEATSGLTCDYYQPMKYEIYKQYEERVYFADDNINEVAFEIKEDEDSNIVGIFSEFNYSGDAFDPDALNGRDGIAQFAGSSEAEVREVEQIVYPDNILGLVESGKKIDGTFNNSRVYILATQWSEDDASCGISFATLNDDKNTEFYINMVRKNCNETTRGIQINGFTGRSSLKNAYYSDSTSSGHTLAQRMIAAGILFEENQQISDVNDTVDFVWIANPVAQPSASDLTKLNNWLDLGNKKIIITYNAVNPNTRQKTANDIAALCEGLRITSRPMYLPRAGNYYVSDSIDRYRSESYENQIINYTTDSVSGCDDGYGFAYPNYQYATSLSGIEFSPNTAMDNSGFQRKEFIPISGGSDFERIISFLPPIKERYNVYGESNNWTIDGNTTVKFPIEPGSGYRVWINWVSETVDEKFDICASLNTSVILNQDDLPALTTNCGNLAELTKTTVYQPQQFVFEFRTEPENNITELDIEFNTNKWASFIKASEIENIALPPKTPRLISISGALLPITTEVNVITTSGLVPDGEPQPFNCRYDVNPATSGYLPGESRPVKHESAIYCDDNQFTTYECSIASEQWANELIEDGPVIVAEEFENFSSFQNGRRRSKIIVIADSTLLQGQCQHYRSSTLSGNQSFIRSLYPTSPDEVSEADVNDRLVRFGKNWSFTQKLRAPECGSVAKYVAISGQEIGSQLCPTDLWGGAGAYGNLNNYSSNEDSYDPTTLSRPQEIRDPEKIRQRIKEFYNTAISTYGIFPRFSGDLLDIVNYNGGIYTDYDELLGLPEDTDRDFILDANVGGGLTELMKIEGTDYLDYHIFNSGCPGDLFGYSIDLSNGKLIVGTPYNAFHAETAISGVSGVVQWHEIQNDPNFSGVRIGADGGAGAAFIFSNTNSGSNAIEELLPWQFTQKIKPSNINVGLYDFTPDSINKLESERGPHNIIDASYILEHSRRGDRFGFSVAMDCDMAVIGAPNHDYETLHHHIYDENTAFQRKSFNAEFDIPSHSFYDLADSGIRVDQFENNSGLMILNGGAVYNYRNEMVDFQSRTQEWIFAEKLYAAGYKSRIQTEYTDDGLGGYYIISSGCEDDNFGTSVSISRAKRGDSDYTLVVGSPYHDWPTSGNHPTSGLNNAGAAYTFDAMLREQIPAIPNSGGWIDAHVFGQKKSHSDIDRLAMRVYQNTSGNSIEYSISEIIFSDQNGNIFLEVSGFDPSIKGFIAHRPYVDRVELQPIFGTQESGYLNFVTSGRPVPDSGNMNLTLLGADTANVYNNLGLYHFGVIGLASGETPSGLSLFTVAPSGPVPSSLNLVLGSTQTTDVLNLRVVGY